MGLTLERSQSSLMSGLVKEGPRSVVVIRHVLVTLGNSLVDLISQRPEIEEFAAKSDSIVVGRLEIIRMSFQSCHGNHE